MALTVSEAIYRTRTRLNISARQVSAMAGLSPSYVGKVEAGTLEPSLAAFAAIAVALNFGAQEVYLLVRSAAGRSKLA